MASKLAIPFLQLRRQYSAIRIFKDYVRAKELKYVSNE